jgi:hypothetical protein
MKSSPSHISQVIGRIRAAWADMDYAHRRLFEIQTGIPVDDVQERRAARRKIKELEALYASDELPAAVRWPYLRH